MSNNRAAVLAMASLMLMGPLCGAMMIPSKESALFMQSASRRSIPKRERAQRNNRKAIAQTSRRRNRTRNKT